MTLYIRIVGGTWFRMCCSDTSKANLIEEVKSQTHVQEALQFLDKITIRLLGDIISIGSDPSNNIILDAKSISPKHCIIFKHLLHWRLKDLNSTNGTYIRRSGTMVKLIEGEFILKKGDKIIIGNTGGAGYTCLLIK